MMNIEEIKRMCREDKINFIKKEQAEDPKHFDYSIYGDFSNVANDLLEYLIIEIYMIKDEINGGK